MSVVLNMIVKNEAHCIAKALKSIRQHIDYYIICDTGSTDGTVNVINNILKHIPGEIHHHKWIDFSTNRNKALNIAKTKGEYVLFLDADDHFEITNDSPFKDLSGNGYYININHDNLTYNRVGLIKSNLNSQYVGVLHEYLHTDESTFTLLDTLSIKYNGNGFRSKNINKFKDDAAAFKSALIDDPTNSRYLFYCAQSYKDAGMHSEAIDYYFKRTRVNGYDEERFISLLMIARLLRIKDPNNKEIEGILISAYNYFPNRAESLYEAVDLLYSKKQFHKAYFYAKQACALSAPTGLFVEPAIYLWAARSQLALLAGIIGNHAEAIQLTQSLLDIVPSRLTKQIESRLKQLTG